VFRRLQTNGMNKVDMMIFIPRFTCLPTRKSPLRQAPRLSVVLLLFLLWRCTHLLDHELIDYQESNPQRVPHIHS
jgi:hypothetical protein